ncbi:MAG: hypothetical protein SP4CHLAM5_02150 [Chlamydiia bacterium]|nr:hypothetical protein [Chlamydiia bacterium]MCH9618089.1 hypothetical protein [Chlamydiia bacterium]
MKNLTKLAVFGLVAAMCLACGNEGHGRKKCRKTTHSRKCKSCTAFVETATQSYKIS